MSWIVRDENGGDRVVEPWNGDQILEVLRERDLMNRGYEGPIRDRGGAWDTINPLGPRSERIEVIPYSEEEVNARKWGLLNSLVDVIKAGGSKLGDFLYGDTDFGYMEGTEEARRRAAEAQRRRDMGY